MTNIYILFSYRDRIRTTNNMLGDCYAAAVVEQLSKKELMALDAAVLYQDTPVTPSGPESVIVEMNNTNNGIVHNSSAKK